MSNIKFKVGGIWKDTTDQYIKVAGVWKKATDIFLRVGGIWHNVKSLASVKFKFYK